MFLMKARIQDVYPTCNVQFNQKSYPSIIPSIYFNFTNMDSEFISHHPNFHIPPHYYCLARYMNM